MCLFLVMVFVTGLLPVPAMAAKARNAFDGTTVTDYRAWSQDQLPWGIERLGKAKEYGGVNYAGCLITAFAKASVQLGTRTVKNVNPGIVNETFTEAGIMDGSGKLTDWKKAASLLGLQYHCKIKSTEVLDWLKKTDRNYGIIVFVKNEKKTSWNEKEKKYVLDYVTHYVLLDKEKTLANNGTIYIHDSQGSGDSYGWMSRTKSETENVYHTSRNSQSAYLKQMSGISFKSRLNKYQNVERATYYVISAPNGCNVTLNPDGGTVSTSSIFAVKGKNYYSSLPTPTRTGYTFLGWYNGNTKITSSNATTSKAITLTAKWSANKYKITFNANGGTFKKNQGGAITVTYNGTYGTLPTASHITRSGYTFSGWYTEKSGGTKITSSTKVTIAGNDTLYARWTPKDTIYKISLNTQGGTLPKGTKSSFNVTYGKTYSALPTSVTKSGYNFKGWYTEKSGGTKITPSTKVTIIGNDTLYAQWTAKTFTVTFNTQGGALPKNTSSTKSVTYNSKYGTLPVPAKQGAIFKGWYTAKSGGKEIDSSDKVSITKNTTLYAQWDTKKVYTVKFNANGGTVATPFATYKTNEKFSALPVPSRSGYDFAGWYTKTSGGTKVTTGTKVSVVGNGTLYARWTPCKHTYKGGICTKCKTEWAWWNNIKSTTAASYQVTNKNGAPVWNRPFSNNSTKLTTMKLNSYVVVVGQVTNTDGNLWYKLSDGSFIFSGNVKKKAVSNIYYIVGTDGTLIINKKASSGSPTGTEIPEGAACVVNTAKSKGNWLYVTYNGVSGYSYKSYMTTKVPSISYYTANSALTIRASASSNGASRGTIPKGAHVAVNTARTSKGWKWVIYNGDAGYVNGL